MQVLIMRLLNSWFDILLLFQIVVGGFKTNNTVIQSLNFAGNDANSYRFRQYLANKFNCHLTAKLEMPRNETHRKWLVEHLHSLKEVSILRC